MLKKTVKKKKSSAVNSKKKTAVKTVNGKKKTVARTVSKSKPVKKVVSKHIVAKKVVHKPQPMTNEQLSTKMREYALLYTRDLDILGSAFWGDLDLACFRSISLDNMHMDAVYSSDSNAIVLKVLSAYGKWRVDTKTGCWKNGVMEDATIVDDLLKQRKTLRKIEPNARVTPAVLLMRGTIENETEVQKYLMSKGIMLIKYDNFVNSTAPTLVDVLKVHFKPLITSMVSNEEWDSLTDDFQEQKQKKSRAKHSGSVEMFNQKERATIASCIATVFHLGYFPKGSGTVGSVVALPIAYILNQLGVGFVWIYALLMLFLGVWAVRRFTANKVEKDPSSVIIDEVVGQTIPFAFVLSDLLHWQFLLIGFILFRFFDICKFGLVKYFDRQEDPWGVMMDDVIAGLQTAVVLIILQALLI